MLNDLRGISSSFGLPDCCGVLSGQVGVKLPSGRLATILKPVYHTLVTVVKAKLGADLGWLPYA